MNGDRLSFQIAERISYSGHVWEFARPNGRAVSNVTLEDKDPELAMQPSGAPLPYLDEDVEEESPMPFGDAMLAVAQGKKVRRIVWPNATDCLFLKDGIVWINRDSKESQLLLSDGDILNNDWVIV